MLIWQTWMRLLSGGYGGLVVDGWWCRVILLSSTVQLTTWLFWEPLGCLFPYWGYAMVELGCANVNILLLFQENPLCTKNNNRDKLLLTSMADQVDNIRGRQKLARGSGMEMEKDSWRQFCNLLVHSKVLYINIRYCNCGLMGWCNQNIWSSKPPVI